MSRFSSFTRLVLILALTLVACDRGDKITEPDVPDPPATPTLASAWIDHVDWDEKTTVTVTMVENGGALSFSPANLTFEAGKPYVLRLVNSSENSGKHYYSPQGTSFYQAIATRKVQTADAEYKAPYFDAVELKIGGALEIYFVPVIAGTYDIICTITGHVAAGMVGSVTITGGAGYALDLEVATDFDQALTTDARRSGSHDVWSNAVEQTIEMYESAAFDVLGFEPPTLELTEDVGYKLILSNSAENQAKHYYTSEGFYKTVVLRKADDTQAEVKAPYLKAVELLVGGSSTLFVVPTEAGDFGVTCTIAGHAEAGMTGTISVSEPIDSPTLGSDWISFVNWDEREVVEVTMVEDGGVLSFSPADLTFQAGKPYVLRILNPAENESKHYYSPQGTSFYKAVATRKVQTADAEYKAPYFDAVELKIGGALEIYFVPVIAGTYDIICTITGHVAAGMVGSVTITGGDGFGLDLEVAADFDQSLATDARRSGSHAVWTTAVEQTIEMYESASFDVLGFVPPNIDLIDGTGYKLILNNPAENQAKHYYTAEGFYKTVVLRKADDTQAEVKAPYLKAVELLVGGSSTLFLVPTERADFDVLCTIVGHAEAGMTGTISVKGPPPTNASDWVSYVNWDQSEVVEVTMVENGGALSFSPADLTFQAGKPYVLRILNPAENDSKHYYSPQGTSFYKAVATRKVQTADAEYKAPYFDAVELKLGGALEIYFVPVIAGTYDIICTITGHVAAGMVGSVTITGGGGFGLDLEVAADFDQSLATDARRSGSHAVWTTAVEQTIEMYESASFDVLGFVPPNIDLVDGTGYKLILNNPAENQAKHYYTAEGFYKTVVLRKADDTQAEVKAPYLKAVELLVGGSSTLFLVPTERADFDVLCTITGHAEAGMTGTISVKGPPPTNASDWVSYVNWDQREVVEVTMVENGGALSFSPANLTFQAGRPYVLRILNPAGNESKHYYSPQGTSFYKAVATRKVQTADAEYKAPYFDAVELKLGGALEIYFVPVIAGTYDIICTITGHVAAGMVGSVTVTGGGGFALDLEVAADFDESLTTDARRSGSHAVWTTAVEQTIGMYESAAFDVLGFVPPTVNLTNGVGYKLILDNPAENQAKHYYTAVGFYKTVVLRKGDDTQAEIKAPYLNAVELLIGGSTTLFLVPTATGDFGVLCTITGHADLGMTGTVSVAAGG